MYHWSLWRKESGHAVPRIADHFFLMNEEEMSSFLHSEIKINLSALKLIFYFQRELLKIYGRENKIAYETTVQ